jgi:hypothetical protein
VRGFPSGIERLALHAWVEACVIFALAPLAWRAALADAPRRARVVLATAWIGTALALLTMAYSARTGMLGMQIRETSALNHLLLLARLAGEVLLATALALGVRAALRSVD